MPSYSSNFIPKKKLIDIFCSLRNLIVAFEAHRAKQYHLRLGRKTIAKTTESFICNVFAIGTV